MIWSKLWYHLVILKYVKKVRLGGAAVIPGLGTWNKSNSRPVCGKGNCLKTKINLKKKKKEHKELSMGARLGLQYLEAETGELEVRDKHGLQSQSIKPAPKRNHFLFFPFMNVHVRFHYSASWLWTPGLLVSTSESWDYRPGPSHLAVCHLWCQWLNKGSFMLILG